MHIYVEFCISFNTYRGANAILNEKFHWTILYTEIMITWQGKSQIINKPLTKIRIFTEEV